MTAASKPAVDIGKRIDQYVKLRDLIKAEEEEFKTKIAPKKELLEQLGNVIMQHLTSNGLQNVKGAAGTASLLKDETVSLADPDAFRRHVIGSEAWELINWAANKTSVREFIDTNGTPPPGVNFTSSYKIGVRRS